MLYSLKLDTDSRVLSACVCLEGKQYENVVDALPEGDITDYKFIDGEFIHEPQPQEVIIPEPTIEERLSAVEDVMLEMLGV